MLWHHTPGSLLSFFNAPPTTEIYTLSLHDALPISWDITTVGRELKSLSEAQGGPEWYFGTTGTLENPVRRLYLGDRKSTRLNSSHPSISYAVFCLKKKNTTHYAGMFSLQWRVHTSD